MTLLEEYNRMKTAMEAAGYPVVLDKGRGTAQESWARAIIAHYLYADRWNNRRVGGVLKRDHSTVTIMRQRVQTALEMPRMYDDVIEIIDNFKKQYHELYGINL